MLALLGAKSLGRAYAAAPTLTVVSRTFATFDERERGEELVHFKKEDERLLRKLLLKVKKSADTADSGAHAASDRKKLEEILGSKVDAATIETLIKWKHESD